MSMFDLQEAILDQLHQVRLNKGLKEFGVIDEIIHKETVYHRFSTVQITSPLGEEGEAKSAVIKHVIEKVSDESNEEVQDLQTMLSDPLITHVVVEIESGGENDTEYQRLNIKVYAYYYYFQVDRLGPIIDGNVVLQGSILSMFESFGPALCTVEYSDNNTDEEGASSKDKYREILTIAPWKMILSPIDDAEGGGMTEVMKFMIPFTIDEEFRNGMIRINVFADERKNIQYEVNDDALEASLEEELRTADKRNKLILSSVLFADHGSEAFINDPTLLDEELMRSRPTTTGSGRDENVDDSALLDIDDADGDGMSHKLGKLNINEDSELKKQQLHGHLQDLLQEHNNQMLHEIQIAADYDDMSTLQSEGYQLTCTHVTANGIASDQEFVWKNHIMAKYGEPNQPGVEDIIYVKCLKSIGTLPDVPFYHIIHDYDLSSHDGDYSIYIAVKKGPVAKFKQLVMISCNNGDERYLEEFVKSSTTNTIYRPAPKEVSRNFDGSGGILLLTTTMTQPNTANNSALNSARTSSSNINKEQSMDDNNSTSSGHNKSRSSLRNKSNAGKSSNKLSVIIDDNKSRNGNDAGSLVSSISGGKYHGGGNNHNNNNQQDGDDDEDNYQHGSDDEDEDNDDDYNDEEDIVARLQQAFQELVKEKESLYQQNGDLQKKAATLMAREKQLQGQSNNARSAGGDGILGNNADLTDAATAEHSLEKDKQYQDTLQLIIGERNNLNKQLQEFDQLALDLQTRLDDKEFKAKSIATSFKEFKKEILLKAENSRTGHHISNKLIESIEANEQKREEELEKVRLRNISLRTTHKKLERTLRAREQLAEGLHMIDFEQLKIENQTLNEKIEERNEELAKLKRKKTTTVQVLTHTREKLRFVEQSNQVLQQKLAALEEVISNFRNTVTNQKLERDDVRMENKELKAKQSFATSDLLLADYESRKNQVVQLTASVTELKHRYELLVRQVQGSMVTTKSSANMLK